MTGQPPRAVVVTAAVLRASGRSSGPLLTLLARIEPWTIRGSNAEGCWHLIDPPPGGGSSGSGGGNSRCSCNAGFALSASCIHFRACALTPCIQGKSRGGPTDIMGQAPQVLKLWRDKMQAYGHPHAHLQPPMAKGIYVAPTMEEALNDPVGLEDFSSRILRWIGSSGAPIGLPADQHGHLPKGYEAWAHRQRDRERRDDPGDAGLPPLRGTPEVVIERLQQVQAVGMAHIFDAFGFPGLPQWKLLRSIELFCTEVLPHFRAASFPAGR